MGGDIRGYAAFSIGAMLYPIADYAGDPTTPRALPNRHDWEVTCRHGGDEHPLVLAVVMSFYYYYYVEEFLETKSLQC